jgi:hypothetical protein
MKPPEKRKVGAMFAVLTAEVQRLSEASTALAANVTTVKREDLTDVADQLRAVARLLEQVSAAYAVHAATPAAKRVAS